MSERKSFGLSARLLSFLCVIFGTDLALSRDIEKDSFPNLRRCAGGCSEESPVMQLPVCAEALLMTFVSAFSQPTFERMLVIGVGAILARARRTVTNIVWTMGELATGDCSAHQRVYSRAP